MTSPAIEVFDLTKSYGSVRALQGVNLSVNEGEIFGFLGPNGAGKTTSIRILFDLIRPTSGRALVRGYDCQTQGTDARALMGYLPGELALYSSLTGQQTLDFFGSVGKPADMRFVRSLVERFGLDASRSVGEYSKGNKQKLGLILALMRRPPVLVLDEPTSGLDPLVQEEVARTLEDEAENGTTVFFSSHVLSEVERMCHRVGIIRAGTIVAVEEIGEVKGRSLHIIEVTFATAVPAHAFALPGVREIDRQGNRLHLEVKSNLDAALKAIARYPVVDLRTEQPSLEQMFLAHYSGETAPEQRSEEATAFAS